jgi:hypothetical protein
MNANLAAIGAWVTALRSGTYTEPTSPRMFDGTRHDVLGVAVEAFSDENSVVLNWIPGAGPLSPYYYPVLGGNPSRTSTLLPAQVARWLFGDPLFDPEVWRGRVPSSILGTWYESIGSVSRYQGTAKLSDLQHAAGATHEQLADIIETSWL